MKRVSRILGSFICLFAIGSVALAEPELVTVYYCADCGNNNLKQKAADFVFDGSIYISGPTNIRDVGGCGACFN